MKMTKKTLTIGMIVLAAALVLGFRFGSTLQNRSEGSDPSRMKTKGEKNAPIHVVEFIDYQCPACAVGSLFLSQFIKERPDQVRLEVKFFPLNIHRHALLAAKYAECAGRQDKFWEFHDMLFQRQNDWKNLQDARSAFDIMAEFTDLDMDILESCLDDSTVITEIEKNKSEGQILGVRSTPTFFVNNEMIVGFQKMQSRVKELADE